MAIIENGDRCPIGKLFNHMGGDGGAFALDQYSKDGNGATITAENTLTVPAGDLYLADDSGQTYYTNEMLTDSLRYLKPGDEFRTVFNIPTTNSAGSRHYLGSGLNITRIYPNTITKNVMSVGIESDAAGHLRVAIWWYDYNINPNYPMKAGGNWFSGYDFWNQNNVTMDCRIYVNDAGCYCGSVSAKCDASGLDESYSIVTAALARVGDGDRRMVRIRELSTSTPWTLLEDYRIYTGAPSVCIGPNPMITQSTTKLDLIRLIGPDRLRFTQTDRNIDIVQFLPDQYMGTDIEEFMQVFEDTLNELYVGDTSIATDEQEIDLTSTNGENVPSPIYNEVGGKIRDDDDYIITGDTPVNVNDVHATDIGRIDHDIPDVRFSPFYEGDRISILEKINRIRDLNDPDLIDIKYIQYLAKNLGYNIGVNRGQFNASVSGLDSASSEDGTETADPYTIAEDNRYLRFVVKNLPYWYRIKSTENALLVMLFSFGIVGEIINYYSQSYDGDFVDEKTILSKSDSSGWFPTPHFSFIVKQESSSSFNYLDPSDTSRFSKILSVIESSKSINHVFHRLNTLFFRKLEIGVIMTATVRGLIRG